MKKQLIIVLALLAFLPLSALRAVEISVPVNSLVKASVVSSVYYYAEDGNRYVFPNGKIYSSWFRDFSQVQTITDEELAAMPLKGNVNYRPGFKMIKLTTDPKVYAVGKSGELRWVKTESLAQALYGSDWSQKIDDVPDVFMTTYSVGLPIENATDFDPAEVLDATITINSNKSIAQNSDAVLADTLVGDAQPGQQDNVVDETPSQDEAEKDTTQPIITTIRVTDITKTTAVVTWITDEESSSMIEYGMASGNYSISKTGTSLLVDGVYKHMVSLDELGVNNKYYYIVRSNDLAGNSTQSQERSFATVKDIPAPTTGWTSALLGPYNEPSVDVFLNGYGIFFTDSINTAQDEIFYLRISNEADILGGGPVRITNNDDSNSAAIYPSIVWDTKKFGLAYIVDDVLRFAIVDQGGNVLEDMAVSNAAQKPHKSKPALINTGEEFVLVWAGQDNNLYITRINTNGNGYILTPKKIDLEAMAAAPDGKRVIAIASNGNNYGMVWNDIRNSRDNSQTEMYFGIIDAFGDRFKQSVKISGTGVTAEPNVIVQLSKYDIFWTESSTQNPDFSDTYFMKKDRDGVVEVAALNLNNQGDHQTNISVIRVDNEDDEPLGYTLSWTAGQGDDKKIYIKSLDLNGVAVSDNQLATNVTGINDFGQLTWDERKYAIFFTNVLGGVKNLYIVNASQTIFDLTDNYCCAY